MDMLARLIDGALDADELETEEVQAVEIEHCYTTIWFVLLTLCDGTLRYSFFDLNDRTPYEPYTTFSPYTDAEMAHVFGRTEVA